MSQKYILEFPQKLKKFLETFLKKKSKLFFYGTFGRNAEENLKKKSLEDFKGNTVQIVKWMFKDYSRGIYKEIVRRNRGKNTVFSGFFQAISSEVSPEIPFLKYFILVLSWKVLLVVEIWDEIPKEFHWILLEFLTKFPEIKTEQILKMCAWRNLQRFFKGSICMICKIMVNEHPKKLTEKLMK